jgi:hypothetical protein
MECRRNASATKVKLILKRYDLCAEAAECLKVQLVDMNGGARWFTIKAGVRQLENAVMETRPDLDRRQVLRMIVEIFRATN